MRYTIIGQTVPDKQAVCGQKPVELEKEIKETFDKDITTLKSFGAYSRFARHFYELGRQSKPKVCDEFEEEFIRYIHEKDDEVSERGESTYAQEDLEDIARHFAQWGVEHRGNSETSKDLEEAANEFAEGEWDGMHDDDGNALFTQDYVEYSFIEGAKWGRRNLLQEIADGKTHPVDGITAAWLDNTED